MHFETLKIALYLLKCKLFSHIIVAASSTICLPTHLIRIQGAISQLKEAIAIGQKTRHVKQIQIIPQTFPRLIQNVKQDCQKNLLSFQNCP